MRRNRAAHSDPFYIGRGSRAGKCPYCGTNETDKRDRPHLQAADARRNAQSAAGTRRKTLKSNGYGEPGRIRTCDLMIRSHLLYPAELRVR